MAEKKKNENVFKRIGKRIVRRFVEVRQEMKRVIWPTRAKLLQVAVVVFAVIAAAAITLTLIGDGTKAILNQVGFYDQVAETTAAATTAETTIAATEATAVAETTAA